MKQRILAALPAPLHSSATAENSTCGFHSSPVQEQVYVLARLGRDLNALVGTDAVGVCGGLTETVSGALISLLQGGLLPIQRLRET